MNRPQPRVKKTDIVEKIIGWIVREGVSQGEIIASVDVADEMINRHCREFVAEMRGVPLDTLPPTLGRKRKKYPGERKSKEDWMELRRELMVLMILLNRRDRWSPEDMYQGARFAALIIESRIAPDEKEENTHG